MRSLLDLTVGCAILLGCAPAGSSTIPTSPAPTASLPSGEWVDLTYAFDEQTLYWPTAPSGFVLGQMHHGPTPGGWFYSANTIAAPEHGGTHLDAPLHFAEGKASTDAVPLSRLIGPAVVVDITAAAEADRDALLRPEDIAAFEQTHGEIAPGTIVLVRTGWGARWPDAKRYLGDDTAGDASNLHFPGIARGAAEVLVKRNVGAVGIDTASLDHGPSKTFATHQVLGAADIPGFENVAHLERLPPTGAFVVALPMKIAGGSGGPLRIVAAVPSSE